MSKYIAWVRYGTSNCGCDDYLTPKQYGDEGYFLSNGILHSPAKFNTLEEAKAAVAAWCQKERASLERAGLHSGKAWNQTRLGAWKYEEVEE